MPKIIKTQLILGGNDFLPRNGYSATVEMAVGGHSAFTVTFPANATETYSGALMDGAINHIGKDMYIGLADGAMEFTGLVTSVDLRWFLGNNPENHPVGMIPIVMLFLGGILLAMYSYFGGLFGWSGKDKIKDCLERKADEIRKKGPMLYKG